MIRSAKEKPISLLAITEGGLRRLYRWSPIAARVALAIADGEKVEQIAASLRLTPDTALLHRASSSEDRRLRATGPMKADPGVLVRQEGD